MFCNGKEILIIYQWLTESLVIIVRSFTMIEQNEWMNERNNLFVERDMNIVTRVKFTRLLIPFHLTELRTNNSHLNTYNRHVSTSNHVHLQYWITTPVEWDTGQWVTSVSQSIGAPSGHRKCPIEMSGC